MDYASGAIPMVETRVREFTKKHGHQPAQLVLHVPTVRRLFTELAERKGLPPIPEGIIKPGGAGIIGGVPFAVCTCGDDLGEDQMIDWDGNAEPL